MKRLVWAAALLAAVGCGDEEGHGARELPPNFERSCSEGEECPGRRCVRVGPNQQGLPGVCSRACSGDVDCGKDAACFLLGDAGASCLALCSERNPCEGGLACVLVGSAGEMACFVEPLAP